MRHLRVVASIAAVILAGTAVSVAGPAGPAAAATCKHGTPSDFNGDGIADVAVAEPHESGSAGDFHVLFGTRSGLSASSPQDQVFSATSDAVNIGEAMVAGDFNGDGCADLAAADPIATVSGKVQAGAVELYQGGPTGLANIDEQLAANLGGGTLAVDTEFGIAMAVGDVNDDGYDDLIVGSLDDAVYVFPGSSVGLQAGVQYVEGAGGVPGGTGGENEFGLALATGDFNGDGHADVAIGARAENNDAGVVVVLNGSTGSAAPLTTTGAQLWSQDATGVPGTAEDFDLFGEALATGDFTGNGRTDLAVGVPGEDLGTVKDAGMVNVIYSAGGSGLSGTGAQGWTQDSSGVPGTSETDDLFGDSLAAGDFNGNGKDDLAVGVTSEAVGSAQRAGAVNVLPGASGGLTASGSSLWNQDTSGISGTSEFGDEFGYALLAVRVRSSSRSDLVVTVPFESLGSTFDAGMFHFIPGSSHGLTATGSQAWTDDSSGVKGVSCDGCELGRSAA